MKRVIKVGAGATGALVAYGSFSFLYFYRTHSDTRSVSHTFKSALCQWLGQIALDRWGEQQLRNFERDTNNADRIQEDLLLNWIKSNQETEYGRAYQFERIKDKEDFKKLHPLTNYSDYENYIAKIMDGKQNILTKEPIIQLEQTTGYSTGKKDLIPVTQLLRTTFYARLPPALHVLFDTIPNTKSLQKCCKIVLEPMEIDRYPIAMLKASHSNPEWAFKSKAKFSSDFLLLHALFALSDRNLGSIESSYHMIHNWFDIINKEWAHLADLIESGIVPPLSDTVIIENKFRSLKPDPTRAQEIRDAMKEGQKGSMAKRLWPHLNVILITDTNGSDPYGKQFREKFIPNEETPVYTPFYSTAEGLIGANFSVFNKTFTLVPRAMFFEFLPIEKSGSSDNDALRTETLFANQLTKEKEYELIITNLSGLYRYRLGEFVKFHGYQGQAPVVEILHRRNKIEK